MAPKSGTLSRLIESAAGNTLPIAAAAMMLSAGLIGGAVDISRAYLAHNRLQAACDAGVLAGRKAVKTSGYDQTASTAADTYFAVNFDQTNEGSKNTQFSSESNDNGNTIVGTATTDLSTTVMKIFGMADFNLSVSCTSSLGVGNSDIMMVLDTTGSMGLTAAGYAPTTGQTSRIQDLRAAMKNFYDTVAEATSSSTARVRYGFVPYSSSVNVGRLIRAANPDYMASTYTVQTRSWIKWGPITNAETGSRYTTVTYSTASRTNTNYPTLSACDTALSAIVSNWTTGSITQPNTESITIDPDGNKLYITVTENQSQSKPDYICQKSGNSYYVYSRTAFRNSQTYTFRKQVPQFITSESEPYDGLLYRKSSYDVRDLLAGNTVNTLTGISQAGTPVVVSSTWNGCIEERQTTPDTSVSYTASQGITPATALDLDIDRAPSSDDATKWKPLWSDVAFIRSTDNPATSGSAPEYACPTAAQLLSEMDRDDFAAYADSLETDGQTYHDIGLIWGARFSSPTGIWQDNVNEEPSNGGTVSRHLIFMTDGALAPNYSHFTSYGIENLDKRVTGGAATPSLLSRHRGRFLAMCEAIKGKGIRLWVISFATTLSDDLKTCSSSNSAYAATDATQLNDAFQKIAKQVGELRVTQ